MGNFHRFVAPSYHLFGGETFDNSPGGTGTIGAHTYDLANVVSGGVGGGDGSANVDAQKNAGSNIHTYFVAFGEDATSRNANRGFKAVFESLDTLDDILRTSIPKRAVKTGASPASDGIQITGDVWCGDSPSDPVRELVAAATSTFQPLYNGLVPVAPTDIDDGTPGNSVVGQGWVTNPTVRFNASVVQSYILLYGARTTYGRVAEQEEDAFFRPLMDSTGYDVEVRGLFQHGLDEHYRRASSITEASPDLDTPGSGATIVRDGQAVSFVLPNQNWSGSFLRPDRSLAVIEAGYDNYGFTTAVNGYGGDIGLLVLDGRNLNSDVSSSIASSRARFNSIASSLVPMDIQSATINGQAAYTYVPAGAAAVGAPGGSSQRIQITAPAYFADGGNTALKLGRDRILVTRADNSQRLVTAVSLIDDVTISINETIGFANDEAITVQWYAARTSLGGTSGQLLGFSPNGLELLGDSPLSAGDAGSQTTQGIVLATGQAPTGTTGYAQLNFGFYGLDGDFEQTMNLSNLGDVNTYYGPSARNSGELFGALHHRPGPYVFNDQNQSYTVNPKNATRELGSTGAGLTCFLGGSVGAPGITPTVTFTHDTVSDGCIVEWYWTVGDQVDVTFVWSGPFVFSDASDAQAGPIVNGGGVIHWRGVQANGNMYMTRVDYPA